MNDKPHDHSSHGACCHHDPHDHAAPPPAAAKYFCPMCDGVTSDKPGACPMCGMALERNPACAEAAAYTCPMHPEVRQDRPGACPICGMALEPLQASAAGDDNAELRVIPRQAGVAGPVAAPSGIARTPH